MADAVQLEMALLNLVTNSVDAMPSGGKLTFHLTRTGDDRLRLEVADTGSGIPADLGAHIFEPWVTTKAPGKGTGLGLSIVRQVIASHGGTIVARNRPGSGAVFTIELPDAAASRAIHSASDAANPDR
jgi:signal transduction histidine kinase